MRPTGPAVLAAIGVALCGCADTRPGAPAGASAGGCSPYVNFPTDIHSNAESPYLGCVNWTNLTAQVVRPADLAAGEALGPASGERAAAAIDTYRQGKIKPFSSSAIAGPTIVMPGGAGGGP